MPPLFYTILSVGFAIVAVIALIKTARIVPQRQQFVIERLGKYSRTLDAGFHLLIPFFDRLAYKHSLKLRSKSKSTRPKAKRERSNSSPTPLWKASKKSLKRSKIKAARMLSI